MKTLAIITLLIISIIWFYISWFYLKKPQNDIITNYNEIITSILIAGNFMF
jgi:preprotein translocase subunit YajC